DRREARFEMVDEGGAPAQTPDSEFFADLENSLIHLACVFSGSLQLVPDFTGHSLAQREHLMARDTDFSGVHEGDIPDTLSSGLFHHVERIRPGHLEIEPVVGFRRCAVEAMTEPVVDPEAAPAEQHEFLVAKAA